jgi:hypothetical protein
MARRDGSWTLTLELDGQKLTANTDQLTLDEIDVAEQAAGIPWSMLNPLRSVRAAKGLLAVLLIRAGQPEDVAVKEAGRLTMEQAADAFTFVPPSGQPLPDVEGSADPPS